MMYLYTMPANGVGVEGEFSIPGQIFIKERNTQNPSVIRDLMSYKTGLPETKMVTIENMDDALEEETDAEVTSEK